MISNITLAFNGENHSIPVSTDRFLDLLRAFPMSIAKQILDHQYYNIETSINQETFDSFKKYLIDSSEPEINSNNLYEFYLISQEFQILTEYLSTKVDEDSLHLSILISNPNTNKSKNEEYISKHLSDIIDKHKQELLKIPISSLVNIFYHPERNLSDHQKAYDFIINNSKNDSLFVLLQSLEADKLNEKSQNESLIKKMKDLDTFQFLNNLFLNHSIKIKMKLLILKMIQ